MSELRTYLVKSVSLTPFLAGGAAALVAGNRRHLQNLLGDHGVTVTWCFGGSTPPGRLEARLARSRGEPHHTADSPFWSWFYVTFDAASEASIRSRLTKGPGIPRWLRAPRVLPATEGWAEQYLRPCDKGGVGVVNVPSIWRGKGARLIQVDTGWTQIGELSGVWAEASFPRLNPTPSSHGTHVLGVMLAPSDGQGALGIAPETSEVTLVAAGESDVTNALSTILLDSQLDGAVVVLPLQSEFENKALGPVELLEPVHAMIGSLVDNGAVVLVAAGNGGLDLDAATFPSDPEPVRMPASPAGILVGGARWRRGAWQRTHSTNWGSAVQVYAQGEAVETVNVDVVTNFDGTSAAVPIVGGVALLLQGAHSATPWSQDTMLKNIVETGVSVSDADGAVVPNLAALFGVH